MNNSRERFRNLLVPILSVVLGLLLGALIMIAFGYNPLNAYKAMLSGYYPNGTTTTDLMWRNIGETLRQATPLIFTALGFSVASAAGFFNIGLSGQALSGWVASIWVALAFPDLPRIVLVPLCILVGALAGAVAAAIPGFLRAFFGTSEVIVTIMLNYILLYYSTYLMQNVMPASYRVSMDSTNPISSNATLRLTGLTEMFRNSRVSGGLFLALITLVLVWFLMKKTTLGFEIRSVGLNPFASEYAGMSSKRTIVMSMVISGLLAGLGGVVEGLGTYQNFFVQTASLSIGFDGMAVSLLGSGTSIGILLSAILFSILKIGGLGMQTKAQVPFEIVSVVIAAIIFFVGANYMIRIVLAKIGGGKKEVAVVTEVESKKDDENSQEGGAI
ncbi:ABC transporter permease [Enterococcus nangangensis]|uniref:ABC transporter permease n=1 Tax=Enterococcus nangangensis TaxID=2559926 RepID=UPI0010F7EC9C|nr:ABC transporter permease [Enterococcus nangangensis]